MSDDRYIRVSSAKRCYDIRQHNVVFRKAVSVL